MATRNSLLNTGTVPNNKKQFFTDNNPLKFPWLLANHWYFRDSCFRFFRQVIMSDVANKLCSSRWL